MDKMTPEVVPLTDEIAKRMGFVNLQAMQNYDTAKLRDPWQFRFSEKYNNLLQQVCNQGQLLIELKQHIERLERQLGDTGTQRIG